MSEEKISYNHGVESQQGLRPNMEDAHDVALNIRGKKGENYNVYCVFDGHGGEKSVKYVKENFMKNLKNRIAQGDDAKAALTNAFQETDDNLLKMDKLDGSGSTAVVALIDTVSNTLCVAWIGDSRAVLCEENKAIALTEDHKADRKDEMKRIRAAGGFVIHKRVMGELAVSRAFGDKDFKSESYRLVIADPDFLKGDVMRLSKNAQFLLLACDGLFDVLSDQAACEFIVQGFNDNKDAQTVAVEIVDNAINKLNTRDNVTCIIVKLDRQ